MTKRARADLIAGRNPLAGFGNVRETYELKWPGGGQELVAHEPVDESMFIFKCDRPIQGLYRVESGMLMTYQGATENGDFAC